MLPKTTARSYKRFSIDVSNYSNCGITTMPLVECGWLQEIMQKTFSIQMAALEYQDWDNGYWPDTCNTPPMPASLMVPLLNRLFLFQDQAW